MFTSALALLFHHFHDLAAATGNDLSFLYMENFMTDGAVNIPLFLCFYHRNQSAFQFHRLTP